MQYILFVLLFLMAGPLCRILAGQSVSVAGNTEHAFSQASVPRSVDCPEYILSQPVSQGETDVCRLFNHSLFAPEITGGALSQGIDLKVVSRTLQVSGYGVGTRSSVIGCAAREVAAQHSRSVDYYIYTLGRIRI